MRDLTVGQRLVLPSVNSIEPQDHLGHGTWVVAGHSENHVLLTKDGHQDWLVAAHVLAADFELATPAERIFEGLYRHRAAGPDDVYYVKGVGIRDEDGHGNVDAPRQVFYESTRSLGTMVLSSFGSSRAPANIRSECEFGQLVTWPDGVIRPRFVRLEYVTACTEPTVDMDKIVAAISKRLGTG